MLEHTFARPYVITRLRQSPLGPYLALHRDRYAPSSLWGVWVDPLLVEQLQACDLPYPRRWLANPPCLPCVRLLPREFRHEHVKQLDHDINIGRTLVWIFCQQAKHQFIQLRRNPLFHNVRRMSGLRVQHLLQNV